MHMNEILAKTGKATDTKRRRTFNIIVKSINIMDKGVQATFTFDKEEIIAGEYLKDRLKRFEGLYVMPEGA